MSEQTKKRPGWSVELFAAFWAKPNPALAGSVLADDAVGYWPFFRDPVRGKEAYAKVITDVIATVPDLSLKVAEHATTGEYVFIRWVATGTFEGKRFESTGIDRVRVRDGIVLENYICSDHPLFEQIAARHGQSRAALRPPSLARPGCYLHADRPLPRRPMTYRPTRARKELFGRLARRPRLAHSQQMRGYVAAALSGLVLLSPGGLGAEERGVPGELLAKLAASSTRFEAMMKKASFTVSGRMSNLSGDGSPSGVKEGVFRLKAGGGGATKVDVLKYAEDGEDKTLEAKKKAEQRAKEPKKAKKPDEELHMPFLETERHKYDFRLGESDPRNPSRVRVHFRAKAPAENLVNGSAWVDARTGHVLTASVAASKTSTFVDYLRARLEFGETTPMGPAVSKVSFEGAGGILFLKKRFQGSATLTSYEVSQP